MLEMYAEDAVFDMSVVFTDAAPARGSEEIVRYWKELQETWGGGIRSDPLNLFDLGNRRAVLEVRLWARARRAVSRSICASPSSTTSAQTGRSFALGFPDVATAISAAESSATLPDAEGSNARSS